MPILIDYSPGGGSDLLNLAQQTGQTQGNAQRMTQQRAIDAQTSRDFLQNANERNNRPDFYQRMSQAGTEESHYNADQFAQTQARDQQQAQAEQQARIAQQGQEHAAGQRSQHANLIEQFNRAGQTPEAAQAYTVAATRAGITPDRRISDTGAPATTAEQIAQQRANTEAAGVTQREGAAAATASERTRANQEREKIQREGIKAKASQGPSATQQRQQQDAEFLGYGNAATDTVAAFEPDLNGKLSTQGAAVVRGLFSPNKSPGEIAARLSELEQAGLNPDAVKVLKTKLADRVAKDEQAKQRFEAVGAKAHQAVMQLPANAQPADIDAALQQAGMTIDDYEAYLTQQAKQLGLTR